MVTIEEIREVLTFDYIYDLWRSKNRIMLNNRAKFNRLKSVAFVEITENKVIRIYDRRISLKLIIDLQLFIADF